MPSVALYGFDPAVTLLGGLLAPPVRPTVPLETTGGVARPLLYGFDPLVTLLGGMARPLYAAVDLSIGPRAELIVTGSALRGGERLLATLLGPWVPLELGQNEMPVVYTVEMGPDLGETETLLPLDVTPRIKGYPFVGRQGADVTSLMVAGLSVVGTTIYLALGTGMTQLGHYRVALDVLSSRGALRTVELPLVACRR